MKTPVSELPGYDATKITDQLYIAPQPHARHVEHVRGIGVDLVLSMTWFPPARALTRPPFRVMLLPTIDSPLVPIPLFILRRGAAAAVLVMDAGGRVLVHCRAGIHRSVAMAASILIARGMTADEAMDTIVAHRVIADPHARHIERRIRAFERDWLRRQRPVTG